MARMRKAAGLLALDPTFREPAAGEDTLVKEAMLPCPGYSPSGGLQALVAGTFAGQAEEGVLVVADLDTPSSEAKSGSAGPDPRRAAVKEEFTGVFLLFRSQTDALKALVGLLRPVIRFRQLKGELDPPGLDLVEMHRPVTAAAEWLAKQASEPELIG